MLREKNTLLLDKTVNTGDGTTTFSAWTREEHEINSFKEKVDLVKGIPKELKTKHLLGEGYWVEITIPTNKFDAIVTDIKNLFSNGPKNFIHEDFTRTERHADMPISFGSVLSEYYS